LGFGFFNSENAPTEIPRKLKSFFVGGKSCGGYDDVLAQHESGTLDLDLSMGENKILGFSVSAALSHSAVGNIFGAAAHASAIGTNLRRRGPPVEIIVECKISQKEAACYILPHLTGLQMKSAILKELGLDGGFGDYYLRCEDVPFGSTLDFLGLSISDPPVHLTALEEAEVIPGKDYDTRIRPLTLTNDHGRYISVTCTPERTLKSVGECPLNI
jgi:hypothetical protein